MEFGYQGGVTSKAEPALEGEDAWVFPAGDLSFFLRAGGCAQLFVWDGLALLIRGYARPAQSGGPLDLDAAAEEARAHYLEYGDLAVEGLDGSFTLALLDAHAGRILLYRNLVGAGSTYYHDGPRGFVFASNLANLVNASGQLPEPNQAALPAFFLYRTVPGHETLFKGFYRLLPGEQVTWDGRMVHRQQWHTWNGMRRTSLPARDCLEALEATTQQILRDIAACQPGTANLLSGGIDSSYLQAAWNQVYTGEDPLPPSCSVCVDHPRTWADTDYAMTAARALGTRHTLVPADGPFIDYLVETIAQTGEPPNHVQTAYFAHLARALRGRGVSAGLCGEGADSLFGLGLTNRVHNAGIARLALPGQTLKGLASGLAGWLGWDRLQATLRLAAAPKDYEDLEHPVNQVAAFADWPAVMACFGIRRVAEAAATRRGLLDRLEVGSEPLEKLHGAGFFGEAVDSASLWTTLFHTAGLNLYCPFLDSRMVRLTMELPPRVRFPFRRPKDLLKRALARHVPPSLVDRPKLGFGQPIFEWMAPGGQLRPRIEAIAPYDFVDDATLVRVKQRPSWFLYSLLCYDVWHKLFVKRSLPRLRPGLAALPAGRPDLRHSR